MPNTIHSDRIFAHASRLTLLALGATLACAPAGAAPGEFAAAVLNDAPVLYYRLSETGATTENLGSYGNGFDGTINGSLLQGVATSSGDAGVQFTGPADFIESNSVAPAELTGNPDFTAETLIRIPAGAASTGWSPFLHWGAPGTGNSVYFSLRFNDNDIIYAGFYNAGLHTVQIVCFDTWLHVVWVRDSSGGGNDSETGTTLFVNGSAIPLTRDLALSPGFDASLTVTSTTFRINRATDFTRYSTIEMDEVALYDRLLTPAEVEAHWLAFANNAGDADGDGVNDANDNCIVEANADQRDSNADGFGNRCDADLDNSGFIDFLDLGIFKSVFFSTDQDADLDGNGTVDFIDLGILKSRFFGQTGPSGLRATCSN